MLGQVGHNVLVIDDNQSVGEEVCEALAIKGWVGSYAGTIDQARERLAAGDAPRIVIVDYHMPGLNGLEVIETLQQEATGRIAFIMLTGDDTQETAIGAVKAQAFDFLRKPVVGHVIADAVTRAAEHLARLMDSDNETDTLKSEAAALKSRINGISEMLRHRENMLQRLLLRDRSALDAEERDPASLERIDTAPLECIPVDISTLMQCMLPAIQKLSGKRQIQLKTRVPTNLPFLYGDRRRIGRALGDLSAVLINDLSKGDQLTILAMKDEKELVVSFKIKSPLSAKKYYRTFTSDLSAMLSGLQDGGDTAEEKLLATRLVVHLHRGRLMLDDNSDSELSVRIFFPLPNSEDAD
jgi:FixJ family two-component response regulator